MEKKLDKKKVVLGFSGSLDSVVCAYLLKKQGYEVIAIGIQLHTQGSENLPDKLDENEKVIKYSDFQGVFLIEDLDRLKKLADALDITFYAAEASPLYKDRVTDFAVAARVGGKTFSPKVRATEIIFDVLMQKADLLGAAHIATGHFAKVVRNKSTETINIFVSNDLDGDQSYLLCTLERRILERMYLPLSDMRMTEVKKIGEGLKLEFMESENKRPLMQREELGEFVSDRIAAKMIREGSIIDYKNDVMIGEHEGIHHYCLGTDNIKLKTGTTIDKDYQVIGIKYTPGLVYVGLEDDIEYQICVLQNVKYAPGIDLSIPQEVFVKSTVDGKKIAGVLYPANNGYAQICFRESQSGLLYPGDHLAFYNRAESMGKILGSGEVRASGMMENGKIRTLPIKKDELDDESAETKDIYGFKF